VNKNTLLISITAIISLALIYTLFQDDDINPGDYQPLHHKQETTKIEKINTDSVIEYKKSEDKSTEVVKTVKKEKPKREKFLESSCIDGKRKFEIALINPNQDLSIKPKEYVNITGKIDGSTFNLKVPDYLITGDNSAVTLRIKDRKTDVVTSTPAYFLDDLRDNTQRHFVTINSNDIDNYEYKTTNRILPLPGNDTIEE